MALLVLLVVGRLVAVRWHRTGAVLVATGAVGLGYLASVQHPPLVAAVVATVTLLPSTLLWLSWQRTATRRTILELAVVSAAVLTGVAVAADYSYSATFGPTHPASTAPAPSREIVDWMWAGAVTDESMTVTARTRQPAERARLLVAPAAGGGTPSTPPDPGDPGTTSSEAVRPGSDGGDPQAVRLTVDGLDPGTRYAYAVEVDGRTDPRRVGTLRTFPRGPASFTFAVGACALTGSNGAVFDAIRDTDPLFVALAGDFLYANIDRNDPQRFREAYGASLSTPAKAALFAAVPVTYVWDDHDYSGNDGDRTAASRPAAGLAYRESVPHYPLELGPDRPLFQAFTVGRVRVVVTDNRSGRTPVSEPDGPEKSMLGVAQRDALLRELRAADRYGAVVWVNPIPWVQDASPTADGWGAFPTERRLIADTLADAGVRNLVMVSGDAHMVALDDGTNTDYSTRGDGGFPLLHAAALDRPGSVKGGPYSGGAFPGGGQFGTVDVTDDGRSVHVRLTGLTWQGTRLVSSSFRLPRP
jgi:hypothetical protein